MTDTNPFEIAKEYDDTTADELSNEELRDVFHEWAEDNKKENTVNFYKQNFRPFYETAQDGGYHLVTDATKSVVRKFLQSEADHLQPKTVGHRYSAISRFYSVLKEEKELIPADEPTPTENLSRDSISGLSEKTMQETKDGESFHYLNADEISRLVDNVPNPEPRNRAMVLLMANTGLRASEVQEVKVENLDLQDKSLTVKSPKLSDKNDPEKITVYWRDKRVSDALDAYLQFDRPTYPFAENSPYLFVSRQSEQVGYKLIRRVVEDAAENAGLQGTVGKDAHGYDRVDVTPHVLRHSFAMRCLENGMNINEVKEALHHEKIETTMTYLREHEEGTKKAIQNRGPRLGF